MFSSKPQFGDYDNQNIYFLEEYCGFCSIFLYENEITEENYISKNPEEFCNFFLEEIVSIMDGAPLYIIPGFCVEILNHLEYILDFNGSLNCSCINGKIEECLFRLKYLLKRKKNPTMLPENLPDWFPRKLARLALKNIKIMIYTETNTVSDSRLEALRDELRLFSQH